MIEHLVITSRTHAPAWERHALGRASGQYNFAHVGGDWTLERPDWLPRWSVGARRKQP
jgi:hypothetical protein